MTSLHKQKRLRYRDGSSTTRKDRLFRPCVESLEPRQLLSAAADPVLLEHYANNPMAFEANQGQTDPQVCFLSHGEGYGLFLTSTTAVLSLQKQVPVPAGGPSLASLMPDSALVASPHAVLTMQLTGANPAPQVVGLDESPAKSNYLSGNDPARWHLNVPNFTRVEYQDVYPGINLIYHGSGQQLEYDFIIAAGADARVIAMNFQGAHSIDLDAQGNLVLHTVGGDVVEHAPVLFQEVGGVRQIVPGQYELQSPSRVAFQVGAYDRTRTLVIDPVLAYSTYLGGHNGSATGQAIAVDDKGNTYITGSVDASDFPVKAAGPAGTEFNGYGTSAYVTKFDPTGQILYSTYLGGNPDESQVHTVTDYFGDHKEGYEFVENVGSGIAVDGEGNVYVTGSTLSASILDKFIGFVPTINAFQPMPGGGDDAFVAKLDATGQNLVYSSYLGGPDFDYGTGIAVDAKGNAYVAGGTIKYGPTTLDSFAGGDPTAFVVKVNADGSLGYKKTLGDPRASTFGNGIAVTAAGDAYIVGDTNDSAFATDSPGISQNWGGFDAFVAHLNPVGDLLTAIRLGGTQEDAAEAVTLDNQGNVYVTGRTVSDNFPTTKDAFQKTKPASKIVFTYYNAFVAKLNSGLTDLIYSTYLGGGMEAPGVISNGFPVGDFGHAIAVDDLGAAYVTGSTTSIDFPNVSAVQSSYGGGRVDAFVVKLDPSGSELVYSTYLGGDGDGTKGFDIFNTPGGSDFATGIAVDRAGNAYVVGTTNSISFPTVPQTPFPGRTDGFDQFHLQTAVFVARLAPPLNVTARPVKAFLDQAFTGEVASFTAPDLDAAPSDFTASIDWGDGTQDVSTDIRQDGGPGTPFHAFGNHSYTKLGAFPVVVTITDKKHLVPVNNALQPVTATTAYDVSQRADYQGEGTIAIDPTDPQRLFAASNLLRNGKNDLFLSYSRDGGVTWFGRILSAGPDPLLPAKSDPKAVFDQFGNLYLTYIGAADNSTYPVIVARSMDGGKSFRTLQVFRAPGGLDRPSVTVGPSPNGLGDSIWVSFQQDSEIVAHGALATGLGQTGTFGDVQVALGPSGIAGKRNFGDIAVGPKGQVLVAYQSPTTGPGPSQVFVNLDADGVGPGGFGPAIPVTQTNIGGFSEIPPQKFNSVDAGASLAWDRSNSPHKGRVYVAYTDAPSPADPDQNIFAKPNVFLRHSDDNGATWSEPVRVNDDKGITSHFQPAIAVDQGTGDVAVSWYDARNDPAGEKTQLFAAVSSDGGNTFSANVQLSIGTSDAQDPSISQDSQDQQYGDYAGLAFAKGFLHPVWTDNSHKLAGNPDPRNFNIATARVAVAHVIAVPPTVVGIPLTLKEGELFTGTVATFTDPDRLLGAGNFTAAINWGDGSATTPDITPGIVLVPPGVQPGFIVQGNHRYAMPGAYVLGITVHDDRHDLLGGTVSNVSQASRTQSEGTIAIDPFDPMLMFAASNSLGPNPKSTLFGAYSTDGGVTWNGRPLADGSDGLPKDRGDPKAVFDKYGNLFLTYLSNDATTGVVVALSTDGGKSFRLLETISDPRGADQPSVAVGPGRGGEGVRVWITFLVGDKDIVASSASVGPMGEVGLFSDLQVGPGPTGEVGRNFGDIAVGPNGQVLIAYQAPNAGPGPSEVFVNLDPNNMPNGGFGPPISVTKTNVGGFDLIPAQNNRSVDAEANLAWDTSKGPHGGRVYLAYTDAPAPSDPDTNIFVRFSDDSGKTWSAPVRVNDDMTSNSQFLPSIAVDPTTGDVGVSWHDARNDAGNTKAEFFAAISSDGGQTFSANVPVSAGPSDATDPGLNLSGRALQYGDYTGLVFLGGVLYPVWTDNSVELGLNPELPQFDIAAGRAPTVHVTDLPLTASALDITADVNDEGEEFSADLATFTDAAPNAALALYTATIDWGDKTDPVKGDIKAQDGKFVVSGKHAYESEGPYTITITITDKGGASAKVTQDINVVDGKLTAGNVDIKPIEGRPFFGQVATFTDTDPNGQPNDYGGSTIDWGDGQTTAGKVVFSGTAAATIINGNVYTISNQEENTVNDQGQPLRVDVLYLTYIDGRVGTSVPRAHPVMRLGSDFTGGLAYDSSDFYPYAISNLANGESFLNRLDIYGGGISVVSHLGSGFTGGLTFDFQDKNFYAISTDGADSALYSITPGSWTVTRVADLGALSFSGLIFDRTSVPGKAAFYAVANDSDGASTLYQIALGPAPAVTSVFVLGSGFTGGLTYGFLFSSPLIGISGDGSGSATLNMIDPNGAVAPLFEIGAHYNDGFAVVGSHTYADETSGPLSVFIKDMGGSHVIAESTFTVIDQPPVAYAPLPLTAVFQGFPTGQLTLASFSVPGGAETGAGEYAATIDWGQGAATAGLLSISGDTITVSSSGHTYAAGGTFHPTVILTDDSGGASTVSDEIHVAPDVSNQVRVIGLGGPVSPQTKLFTSSGTIANVSGAGITGPLRLVIRGLPAGVALQNQSGLMSTGEPYIDLPDVARLDPDQAKPLVLVFANPSLVAFTYSVITLDGPPGGFPDGFAANSPGFMANDGQADPSVRFLAQGSGYTLFLTPDEAVLALRKAAAPGDAAAEALLRLQLIGATSVADPVGLDPLPGRSNYLLGDDPSRWHTNVATYGRIEYRDVYPGITLAYHSSAARQLEYDFTVVPGADPGIIQLAFQGADSMTLDAQGNLVLHTAGGDVVEQAPLIYQESNGVRQTVAGSYELKDNGQVGIRVGPYDRAKTLVIDPVLVYSTYLGGNEADQGNAIAVDAAGNVYVTGLTFSPDFPALNALEGAPDRLGAYYGGQTAFLTKFDGTGAVVFSTYLGGKKLGYYSAGDSATGVALDAAGDVYLVGTTSSLDFPTVHALYATTDPFHSLYPITNPFGSDAAFVAKLDPTGSDLLYSTYLGDNITKGSAIAVDGAGNAYVTGYGEGSFPTTTVSMQGNGVGAFVAKLSTAGDQLLYGTYLAGTNDGRGIAVDAAGNAYVTGTTYGGLTVIHSVQATSGGGANTSDAFVAKLNAGGTALVYSTYLGGSGNDVGNGIAVDAAGLAYVTGTTDSLDFPTSHAIQAAFAGGTAVGGEIAGDAFAAKLSADGSALIYSTYLGGGGRDTGNAIAVDGAGNAYVTGQTDSTDFPISHALQPMIGGQGSDSSLSGDAFVARLNAAGSALDYSTYLGGNASDRGSAIAADAAGNAYVTGFTTSTNLRTVNPAQPHFLAVQDSLSLGRNAFVARIAPQGPGVLQMTNLPFQPTEGAAFTGVVASFTDTDTDTADSYTATIDWGDGRTSTGLVTSSNIPGGFVVTGTHTYAGEGQYAAGVTIREADGSTATAVNTAPFAAAATGFVTYHVTLDTSGLVGTSGFLDFQFNSGALPVAQQAGVTVSNFSSTGGALTGAATSTGDVAGTLTNALQLRNTSVLNEQKQGFTFGSEIHFDVRLDGEALAQPGRGLFGSTLSLVFLGPDGQTSLDAGGAVARITLNPDGATNFVAGAPGATPVARATVANTINVGDAALRAVLVPIAAVEGTPFSGTVAAFTDANVASPPADFTAFIQWGDGSAAASGTIVADGGGKFHVTASHTYSQAGSFPIQVQIQDKGGSTVSAVPAEPSVIGGLQAARVVFSPNNPGASISTFAVGDLNGDARPDLAFTVFDTQTFQFALKVMLSDGDGTFKDAMTVPTPAGTDQFVVEGDVNGDGKLDLITGAAVYLGNGDGTFQPARALDHDYQPRTIVTADLNGDGNLDLIMATGVSVVVRLGNGDGTFQAPAGYSAGLTIASIVAGDFNLDGKLDLVFSDFAGTTYLLTNNGDGTFQAPVLLSTDFTVGAATDLNGDGQLDLVGTGKLDLSGTVGGTVKVLLGNGDGTFQAAKSYFAGPNPFFPFQTSGSPLGDFNGDGKLDLAVLNFGFSNHGAGVTILLGKGDGTFAAPATFPTGNANALAAGDFNGDGHLDLVVAGNTAISLLLGNGDGTLVDETSVPAGTDVSLSNAHVLAVGDFNQDGRIDVATGVTDDDSSVNVLIGTGGGAFQTAIGTPPNGGGQLFSGDFNGDGRPDIISVRNGVPNVAFGNGDGTYQPGIPLGLGDSVLAIGDFNGDGKLDVVVNSGGNTLNGTGTILLGNGDGTFRTGSSFATGYQGSVGPVGDFNGDGKLDLVLSITLDLTIGSRVAGLLGNGDGTFQAPVYSSLQGNYFYGAPKALGDFNGDGRQDLVILTGLGLTVLLGNGDGTFQPTNSYPEQGGISVTGVAAADLNGDGKQDLVVNGAPNTLDVLLGNGDGTFRKTANYAFGVVPVPGVFVLSGDFNGDGLLDNVNGGTISLRNRDGSYQTPVDIATGFSALALGDFNGDGKLDLLGTTLDRITFTTSVTILLGNGDGTFRTGWNFATDPTIFGATVGDFSGDGKLDFVLHQPGNKVGTFLGNGDGTFQAPVYSALQSSVTFISFSAIGDFNGDGKQDLILATSPDRGVSVLLGNGDGTFQPPVTYDKGAFVQGIQVADFNGDGTQDLVVTGLVNSFDVLLGNGDGTFQKPTTHSFGPYPGGVVVGDFTGNGKLDIATTTAFAGSAGVILLSGNGDGTFQQAVAYAFSGIDRFAVAGAIIADDVNKDGRPDLIVANSLGGADIFLAKADGSFQAGRNYPLAGGPIYLSEVDLNRDGKPDIIGLARILTNGTDISRAFVMLNRGDGTFQPPADYAIGLEFTGATQAVTGDFNGDGIPDLVVETYQPDLFFPGDGILSLGVLLGNVDGTLQKIQYSTVLPDQLNSVKLVAGDFNGDGMLDLARFGTRTDGTPVLETYLGKGDGTFEAPLTYTSLDNVDLRTEDILELATADFNGDGKLDLVLNNSTEKSVSVLLGNGDGSFEKPIDSAGANVGPSTSYATGDLNGDGKIDLVTANRDGTVSLLLGNGDGTFQQPLTYFNVLTGNAVFGPIPIVVADFNGDGVPDVGVLAGDRLAVLLNRRGHGPAQNVADAPLTATGTNHPATKDVTFLGTAAHFTDANPLATVGDFTATIAWGDGHTSPGTIMPDGNGGFTVLGSNVFSTTGTFAVTAVVEDRDGTGATVSGSVIVTAGPYTLLSAAGTSIAATARVAFTGTVSTFTSSDASVMAEDFTATITWGDGHTSPGFVRASASGGFEVQGVNTYAQPGNFAVTVAIVHTAGATTSTSGSAAVAPNTAAPLTATGATIAPTERILFTGLVATFIDGDPSGQLADYGALIDWGDGQFSTGTVTADQRIAGQFDVSGSHAYHQVGTLPVTVTLVSRTGARGTAIGEADIVAAPLTIHGLDLNPTEGAPFTGVVATFVDAIPFTAPSAYVATINWGDGHTSPGTVTADPQAAGMFDVAAGNTYARFGLYSITTTIEARGHATTAQALADVADAPLSVLGASINATAGSPYTGIVASFMDPNPAGAVGDYAATIFWGNGHISPGSITANAAGGFDVSGTNTYSDGGKSPVLVWIQDAGGASATVASTAIIVEPTGAITADMLQATEGMESLGVVAWFTAPPNRQLGDFAAVIDWGDGHATTGTFVADPSHVGQIGVQGTSTYAEEGQFTVAVTIATRGGVAATINSTAIVADAPLTAGGVPVQAVTGQTLTSIITTFIDTNAAGQLSDFTAQINWGDGQTSTGTITADPSMAGQFDVTGTVTYAQRGSFPVSVTVKDAGGANVVARSIAKVVVLPTAAGTSTTAQAGVPFNKVVATIADANPEDSPGDFTATIGWGDGYTTPGLVTLSSDGTNTFVVLGSATYVKEGESPVSIVLTRRDGLVLNASSSVTVGPAPDAPLFPLASIPVTAEQNRPATAVVALFRDSDVTATAADLTASINWGDGVSSSGIVVSAGTNSDAFIVVGSHTYTQPGAHLVTTAIEDVGGAVTSVSTGVVVTASQVSGLTALGTSLQSFERSQFKGTVASFTDAAAESQPADFTAAIDWGDGRTSSGNIIATGPGTFDVAADHTYLDETQFVIHVQIADHTGDSVTAQSSMTVLEELLPDGTRGTPNQRFVSELYRDLLRRHVEPGGLASWSGLLEAGVSRADVTLGIIKSPEYRTDVVEDLYHLYLHRAADPVGLHDDVAFLTSGGSQKQLAAFIVSSPEYYQSRAQGASSGYLDALYHDALNRSVDASGRSSFGAQLTAGVSRRDIADQIFNSPEYQIDLVRSIYFRYLDRDLDPSGLETWTALKKNVASDDYLLAQILGETVHHEFYDKTLR